MNGASMPGDECPKIVGIAYCYPFFMSQQQLSIITDHKSRCSKLLLVFKLRESIPTYLKIKSCVTRFDLIYVHVLGGGDVTASCLHEANALLCSHSNEAL
jgi:hypothetical protein